MKYAPKKVFVLENETYIELTYDEFCERSKNDSSYAAKYFLPLHGMLLEVKLKDYREFYKAQRRWRYLSEQSKDNGDVSYDSLSVDELERTYAIRDQSQDTMDQVIHQMMTKRLAEVLPLLSTEEQKLIYQHFFEERSEAQLGHLYGVSQQAISRRLRKIIEKIKKMMKI